MSFYNNTNLKLAIKRSNIPNAGDGLFAEQVIEAGTIIGKYDGKQVSSSISCNKRDYYMKVNRRYSIDASGFPRCFIAMANDSINSDFTNNCKFIYKKKEVWLMAISDIHIGDELFVSYGDDYWL